MKALLIDAFISEDSELFSIKATKLNTNSVAQFYYLSIAAVLNHTNHHKLSTIFVCLSELCGGSFIKGLNHSNGVENTEH